MSKFNKPDTRPAVTSAITTEAIPSTRTAEGGPGYTRDAKSELFLLAVSNMVGEDTFYERAKTRDDRYLTLVRQVAVDDAGWILEFVTWLRREANMRSAAIVAAAEAVKVRLDTATEPRPSDEVLNLAANRSIIAAALDRADEPGEMLAYWQTHFGRALPKPVKRGVGDAIRRLYNEYALLKYDTASKGFRFGDVLNLTHPEPGTAQQGDLFQVALDRRHHGENTNVAGTLPMLVANLQLRLEASDNPAVLLDTERLREAGMTWEDALSLAGSTLDKAALWTGLAPTMGYMALLRNLRNFDQAGVSDEAAAKVAARLTDPAQVAKSRQFPFRFWSAYRATADTVRWAHPLQLALDLSLANVPALSGRTLVLVDVSPSMYPMYSGSWSAESHAQHQRTGMAPVDFATLFGSAVALRAASADLVQFGDGSTVIPVTKGGSLLPLMGKFEQISGTNIHDAIAQHYAGHDRVIILTDEQTQGGANWEQRVPGNVPLYVWNFGGYRAGAFGGRNRHTFGGLTDQAFRLIPLLEAGQSGKWPWQ